MQIEAEYLDFLQNIEAAVLELAKTNSTVKDADIIKAYERLVKFYQRKKQHLPELESTLSGNAAVIFNDVKAVCEWRRRKDPGEEVVVEDSDGLGHDVPITILIRCLEKLQKSAVNWNKKDGPKGYLNLIGNFIV